MAVVLRRIVAVGVFALVWYIAVEIDRQLREASL
jgi:hypothetical protein